MKIEASILAFIFALGATTAVAHATEDAQANTATAKIINTDKEEIGEAHLTQTPNGVLIRLSLSNITPGTHAFHIHQVGKCDPPDFKSASGHFNPSAEEHGILDKDGKHAGDLPNIHVPESGTLTVEALATHVAVNDGQYQVLDPDGSALVIHTGPDDYRTNPAGDAGQRIACGVITATSQETSPEGAS